VTDTVHPCYQVRHCQTCITGASRGCEGSAAGSPGVQGAGGQIVACMDLSLLLDGPAHRNKQPKHIGLGGCTLRCSSLNTSCVQQALACKQCGLRWCIWCKHSCVRQQWLWARASGCVPRSCVNGKYCMQAHGGRGFKIVCLFSAAVFPELGCSRTRPSGLGRTQCHSGARLAGSEDLLGGLAAPAVVLQAVVTKPLLRCA
jgi:hypothetical protein